MKSIKQRVLMPFLALIILIPMITLLIFNIAMNIYIKNAAIKELKKTEQTMNALVKSEFFSNYTERDSGKLEAALLKINSALRASKLSINTEAAVISGEGLKVFPKSSTGSFLNDEIINVIYNKNKINQKNKIDTVRVSGKSYVYLYKGLGKSIKKFEGIVFVSSLNDAKFFIMTINIILISIMCFFILISIFIANHISNTISKQVKRLCSITGKIGNGEFHIEVQNSDILEIHQLEESIAAMFKNFVLMTRRRRLFSKMPPMSFVHRLCQFKGIPKELKAAYLQM